MDPTRKNKWNIKVKNSADYSGVATSSQVCTTIDKKIEHRNNEMQNNEKEERKL